MSKNEFCTHCEWIDEQQIVPVEGVQVCVVKYNPKCLCEGCAYVTSYAGNEEGTYSDFRWTKECAEHRKHC